MAKQLRNFRVDCSRREGSGPEYHDGEWLFDKLNAERPGRERALEPKQAFWMAGAGGDDTPVLVNLKKKATLSSVKRALAQAVGPDYIYSVEPVETSEKGEKFVPGEREAEGRCLSTIEREAFGAGGESPATFVLVDASQKTIYSYDGQGGVSRLSREPRDPSDDAGSTADSLQGFVPSQGLSSAGEEATMAAITLQSLSQQQFVHVGLSSGRADTDEGKVAGGHQGDTESNPGRKQVTEPLHGKYEEAKPLPYKRSLAVGEKVLDPDHPTVAPGLNDNDVEGLLLQQHLPFQRPGSTKRGRASSMVASVHDVSSMDDATGRATMDVVGEAAATKAPLPAIGSVTPREASRSSGRLKSSVDRDVLCALYSATGGASWQVNSNWNADTDLSQWHGVGVNEQGRVITIDLKDNNLTGTIPPELGSLHALQHLDISMNHLGGPIPKELGALRQLKCLRVGNNQLTGTIPPELNVLAALQELDLHENQLSGPIPPELGNLGALQQLVLRSNRLTGPIPPELGYLSALVILNLDRNQLSGPIPPELGNLAALQLLHLSVNQLSGSIPKELGALTKLRKLKLYVNELTGPIPLELGNLGSLQHGDVSVNRLSGTIPKELVALGQLERLSLRNNQLTAFWDHRSDIAGDGERPQESAAGCSCPKELSRLLALFSKLEHDKRLGICNNPWKEPPEAVVKKGLSSVREYYNDLFAEGTTIRRNMIKVVLVGQEGAGKTSLRQSIRNRRPTPTSGPEESTVLVDVEEMKMDVDDVSLRVYDCAGQVAYTGLLQMFLSPRAVFLLVCNASAFGQRSGGTSDRDELKQDVSRLQELRVIDWLRSLSVRIPDSDVVVVATKCDLAGGMAADLAARMERAIRKWLELWSDSKLPAVRVEDGVSLTSCVPRTMDEGAALGKRKSPEGSMWACDWREDMLDEPPPGLLHRVMYNDQGDLRGGAMVLPASWNIALEVLDAFGSGRDPVEAVRQKEPEAEGPKGDKSVASTKVGQLKGIEGLTLAELSAKWSDVVGALSKDGVKVCNPNHALEGALSIREYEGSLVRHEAYIFLDVTWLARILKPLLNHKDEEDPFRGSLSLGDTGIILDSDEHIASWKRFKYSGVLEPTLAGVLWPDGLSDYVLPTLDSLGLIHPLDGDSAKGLVVLLRLGGERPKDVGDELDAFRRDHVAVLTVTWKIFMGVPPGAIEKVLMRCCSLGALRTFWRFGVLVQGGFGAATAGKTFALLMEYSHDKTELEMKVYGNIGTAAPWAALSFGVSAIRMMCVDFPGLRWRAALECPQHGQDMQINMTATRPGDKLLLGKGCNLCSSETGGLGAAAADLLEMIDHLQSRGEIFREVHARFIELQNRYPDLRPTASQVLRPEQAQHRFDAWLSGMKAEVEGLLDLAKTPSGADGVDDTSTPGKFEDILHEVAKLQGLGGDEQLGQHQDPRERVRAASKSLAGAIDADDGVLGKLDFVVSMLMAVRAEGFDTPRQACVLPPWKFAQVQGLSEDEQAPEVWVKRLGEWSEDDFKQEKGIFKKKKRLFLVCAHTHRLVPCGSNGQGYEVQLPRSWFRMSPNVATFAQQVTRSTLMTVAAPQAGSSAAGQATPVSAMEKMVSMLESLTLDDGADVDVAPQVAQQGRDPYAALREFIHGMEDTARLDIAKGKKGSRAVPSSSEFVFFSQKMTQVRSGVDGKDIQWVLKGQEDAWYDARRARLIP